MFIVRPVSSDQQPDAIRRTLVRGFCGASCAAALTACGAGRDAAPPPVATPTPTPAPVAPPPVTTVAPPPTTAAPALAATSDIPVGGGKVFADKDVVVTQPTSGDFKAFSATCTHQGCKVKNVANGLIVCPCHGSKFAIADGSPQAGPAKKPLPAKTVAVDGDSVVLEA